jgi:MFS family permease
MSFRPTTPHGRPIALWGSFDIALLFAARSLRLFGYGLISIVLVLYLVELGLSEWQTGVLLSLTLIGDTGVSLWISTRADRAGRKKMLLVGAVLMAGAGIVFGFARQYWLLLPAATVGVISPSGHEVGPFLSIEQAALSQVASENERTNVFARYHLAGALATAVGALAGGVLVGRLHDDGWSQLASFRGVIGLYAAVGALLGAIFSLLTPAVESNHVNHHAGKMWLGLHGSKSVILRLSSLFALDSFAGGFVVQSIMVYWFHLRFGLTPPELGTVFFGANLLAGVSALCAVPLARRIGLVETMVVTHIPSNLLLMLVPLMPRADLAVAVLLVRFSISQMDVPTRQSYVMSVVAPDERSAAAGVTGVARTAGAAVSPAIAAALIGVPGLVATPFLLAGGLKVVYDLLVWRSFRQLRGRETARGERRLRR